MRWNEDHESPDVIDRRGEGGGGAGLSSGGIFLLFTLLRSPFGWVVVLAVAVWFGLSHLGVIGGTTQRSHRGGPDVAAKDRDDKLVRFVSFVLDDAQDAWVREFDARGKTYRRTKLVLFTDATRTGCGYGRAATGPFYCPADERVYIDLGFYRALSGKLGARGQFAQAYVVAHEIGHHVQKLTGTTERVRRGGDSEGADGPSVRLELQADCYAGIWAHSTGQRNLLESGDIASALQAAAAIGDDRLQRMSRGTVSPESWTHGSSAQRKRWFKRGYETGRFESCDTFSATSL
jgi:uncharacterized protein